MLNKPINALNALDLTHRKMPNVLRAKCIVAGDPAVGKSCLVQSFSSESIDNEEDIVSSAKMISDFNSSMVCTFYGVWLKKPLIGICAAAVNIRYLTCGVDIRTKKVSVPDTDDVVEMFLYDSSGKDIYSDMLMQLWQQPSMICLVFDVTNKNSLDHCTDWLDAVKRVANKHTLPGVLIACKIDLVNRRNISSEEASEFAKKNNLCYFECSVKENNGVEEPFFYLVSEWHKLYLEKTEYFKTLS